LSNDNWTTSNKLFGLDLYCVLILLVFNTHGISGIHIMLL